MNDFIKWFKTEKSKDKDNIFPPPLDPQLALNFLRVYLLGEDWYSNNSISSKQINTEVVFEILFKYSKRFRKEWRKNE